MLLKQTIQMLQVLGLALQSSKSLLNSVKLQVKAAEIANEGITVEYESGLGRSTLDVIQSNSILLKFKNKLS